MDQEALLVAGYQPYELGIFAADHPGIAVIRHCLRMHLQEMADKGMKWVVISGEPGVELWAAEETLKLKKVFPDLKLAVLMPFLGQEERYKDWIREQYQSVLEKADFTGAISNRPYESPVQLRQKNDFLVAKTDGMLILSDEEKPGSPRYYLAAARKRAKRETYPVTVIDRYDLELASEDLREQDPDYWAQM